MILHLINKSPDQSSALKECVNLLQGAGRSHALLLIEDAVYAALVNDTNKDFLELIGKYDLPCYVLKEDLFARGISDKVSSSFTLVDYSGFLQLSIDYAKVQSWS